MKVFFIALVVAGAILLIDRVATMMERRGWIYWRERRASPGTRAAAGLEIQSLLEPGRRYTVEAVRQEREAEDEDAGDDLPTHEGKRNASDS